MPSYISVHVPYPWHFRVPCLSYLLYSRWLDMKVISACVSPLPRFAYLAPLNGSRDSIVSIATGLWEMGKSFVIPLTDAGTHWALYSIDTEGTFPGGRSGRGMKLATHLHPVPRLRMRGAIRPFPIWLMARNVWAEAFKHCENCMCDLFDIKKLFILLTKCVRW
jgi:hypothetical protein